MAIYSDCDMFTSSVTECLLNYLYHCFLPLWGVDKLNRSKTWISAVYIAVCQGCCQWEIVLNPPMTPYYLLILQIDYAYLEAKFPFPPVLVASWGCVPIFTQQHMSVPKSHWPCLRIGVIEQCEVLLWEKLEYTSGFFFFFYLIFSDPSAQRAFSFIVPLIFMVSYFSVRIQ